MPAAVPAEPDPIAALIETSRKHFEAGERELKVGHLEQARAEFDIAVDVMLESPYGARTDARTREHFDRLIDRINAYEVTALAQGDGFVEKKYEPASIDELLKIATFPKPDADAQTTAAVKQDLAATEHDVPIPQNSRVLAYVEMFQGRLRDFISDGLTRGTKYLPMIQSVFGPKGCRSTSPTSRSSKAASRPMRCRRPVPRDRGSSCAPRQRKTGCITIGTWTSDRTPKRRPSRRQST